MSLCKKMCIAALIKKKSEPALHITTTKKFAQSKTRVRVRIVIIRIVIKKLNTMPDCQTADRLAFEFYAFAPD